MMFRTDPSFHRQGNSEGSRGRRQAGERGTSPARVDSRDVALRDHREPADAEPEDVALRNDRRAGDLNAGEAALDDGGESRGEQCDDASGDERRAHGDVWEGSTGARGAATPVGPARRRLRHDPLAEPSVVIS